MNSADCWGRTQDRPAYSVDATRVVKGCVVVAWLRRRRGRIEVVQVGGPLIGIADSPAEAMLMAIGNEERRRS